MSTNFVPDCRNKAKVIPYFIKFKKNCCHASATSVYTILHTSANTTASLAVFNHPSLVLRAVSFCGPDVTGMVAILATCKRTENRQNHSFGDNTRFIHMCFFFLRTCLHQGGVPQVGEVTACPYNLPYGHPTYHVNVITLK